MQGIPVNHLPLWKLDKRCDYLSDLRLYVDPQHRFGRWALQPARHSYSAASVASVQVPPVLAQVEVLGTPRFPHLDWPSLISHWTLGEMGVVARARRMVPSGVAQVPRLRVSGQPRLGLRPTDQEGRRNHRQIRVWWLVR